MDKCEATVTVLDRKVLFIRPRYTSDISERKEETSLITNFNINTNISVPAAYSVAFTLLYAATCLV